MPRPGAPFGSAAAWLRGARCGVACRVRLCGAQCGVACGVRLRGAQCGVACGVRPCGAQSGRWASRAQRAAAGPAALSALPLSRAMLSPPQPARSVRPLGLAVPGAPQPAAFRSAVPSALPLSRAMLGPPQPARSVRRGLPQPAALSPAARPCRTRCGVACGVRLCRAQHAAAQLRHAQPVAACALSPARPSAVGSAVPSTPLLSPAMLSPSQPARSVRRGLPQPAGLSPAARPAALSPPQPAPLSPPPLGLPRSALPLCSVRRGQPRSVRFLQQP